MAECSQQKNDKDNCIGSALENPLTSTDAVHSSSSKEGKDCTTSYDSSNKTSYTLAEPKRTRLTAGREAQCFRADFEDVACPINGSYGDPAGGVNTPEQETQEGGGPCVLVMGNELSLLRSYTGDKVHCVKYRRKLRTHSPARHHSAPPAIH